MTKKPLKASDLNAKFTDSKSQLNEHLAESRTNVNLFIGNHFQKKASRLSRGLEKAGTDSETKIRVTKNHTNTICKYVINSILGLAPTGVILPKNPTEIQDQKAAEIHGSILEDFKIRNKFNQHVRRWAHDYVINGEVIVNMFWDPTKGNTLGVEQVTDETGEVIEERPIKEGDVTLERVYSWDLRGDTGAKSIEESSWLGYEKMVGPDVVRKLATPDNKEAIEKAIKGDTDDTYQVFDGSNGSYDEQKGNVLLRKMYFRPCSEYPNGYFVFFTKEIIITEGELPVDKNGNPFFPIKYLGFDEIPTSPRSASMIRMIRPDQMEVNRCASAIALTQMTVGFDKMITNTGSAAQSGPMLAGIRTIQVPGGSANASVIPGRAGDQFLNTMTSAISEMYRKTGVPEAFEEKTQDTDILASLYKNQRQKMRFSLYADKFSEFLVEIIEEVLKLKKAYMLDESFVRVVGKNEQVNIPEFRSMEDIGFQIKVEPGSEDLETRYGKHLSLTNTMQYLGQNLDKNTIGMLLKQMPFGNSEEIYGEYTIEYDTARNIMLALDRGEFPEIVTSGSPDYFLKTLEMRKYKPDFQFLPFQVQDAYLQQIEQYKALLAEQTAAVQRAQSGFIPADGPSVPVEGMYEQVPGSNGQVKNQRVQLPQSSLMWLVEQLKAQKLALGNIQQMPLGQQAGLAQTLMGSNEMPPEGQAI